MMNPTPVIIDLTAVNDGYIVKPGTSCYFLQFNRVTDVAVRFRYNQGQPWLNVAEGDAYDFECVPIQTGIYFDISTPSGPNPAVIVQVVTYPDGMEVQ